MTFLTKILISLGLVSFGVIAFLIWRKKRKEKAIQRLETVLLEIKFPKSSADNGDDLMQELSKMEQLFKSVSNFGQPVVFETAVSHIGKNISFFVSVPNKLEQTFTSQIHSLWSDAVVERADDYNVFNHSGYSMGGWINQDNHYSLPFKTYKDIESDTFQSILGGFSKVNEVGEGAALQFVITPASSSEKNNIKSKIKALKKGKDPSSGNPIISFLSSLEEVISGRSKNNDKNSNKDIDKEKIKALEKKLSKSLFRINTRIAVSAPTKQKAESIFDGLTSPLSQFASPESNTLSIKKPRNFKKFSHSFSFREFNSGNSIVVNSEELSSIFNFPTSFTDVPNLNLQKARQLSAPTNIPNEGLLLGENIHRGKRKNIYITDKDRRRHLYMVGQTGTGKSNLMVNLVHQDIKDGKGTAVIDPHGDLIDDILGLVPESRKDDVIVFDPSRLDKPIGLNMLEYDLDRPEEKTFIVNEMIEIFDKLYDLKKTGGPMFEQYMKNALLLLMEDAEHDPATLMEVPRIFTDSEFRNRKLDRISNPTVVDFWRKEASKAGGEASLENITPYITSKFNNFTSNEYTRVIVGQTESSFDFRKVMDEGKILLVNLSKGKIGDLNANLLGMIIVGKLLIAALSRVDIPQESRRDFNLFIDEFQNFTTDSIATILSEARKYRLNLTIAHQFIAQLKDDIRDSVFGNVGSLLSFRVGAPSAEVLEKQFEPELSINDLVNIDNFNAYVKLLVHGETTDPFNIKTFKAESPDLERAKEIKENSINKYGRSREEVEKNIRKRLRE